MACPYCDFKGYITSSFFANNNSQLLTRMCPMCRDIVAYSNYVSSLYSSKKEEIHPQETTNLCRVVSLSDHKKISAPYIVTESGCKVYDFMAYKMMRRK